MKINLLVSASGVSLLYLLAGFLPVEASSVEISNSQAINSNELLSASEILSLETTSANTIITKINHRVPLDVDRNSVGENRIFTTNENAIAQPNKQLNKQLNKKLIIAEVPQNQAESTSSEGQVTSVSQLSDVQPTDWAFQALQSLVERYGCIAGYPNGTYRGNRAMTRYEFAAGLNACLAPVTFFISMAVANSATKEDLLALQRLQQEFQTELATLRGRVDALEARSAELEANQFSTTTKLQGEAIFAAIGATGGVPGSDDPNIILTNRVRLNLNTSFTGKDLLITGLQAHNFLGGVDGSGSLQQELGLTAPGVNLAASSARTGIEPQFPSFTPKDLSSKGANDLETVQTSVHLPRSQ